MFRTSTSTSISIPLDYYYFNHDCFNTLSNPFITDHQKELEEEFKLKKAQDDIETMLKYMDLRTELKFNSPQIRNIEVKNNPEDEGYIQYLNGKYQKPTVIVTFSDGTTEKATTSEDDTFSLEQGISICYTKKLLSMLTTDSGSKQYNKMLHNAMKLYKSQQEETVNKEKKAQLAKERAEKLATKRAKRKAKLEAKKREQEISVQAEAYARALKMVNQDKEENK